MGVCGEAIVTIDVQIIRTYEMTVIIEADEWPAAEDEQRDLLSQLASEQFCASFEEKSAPPLPPVVAETIADGPFVQDVTMLTDPVQMVADDLLRLAAELRE